MDVSRFEKSQARELYAVQRLGYAEIGRRMNRVPGTIKKWKDDDDKTDLDWDIFRVRINTLIESGEADALGISTGNGIEMTQEEKDNMIILMEYENRKIQVEKFYDDMGKVFKKQADQNDQIRDFIMAEFKERDVIEVNPDTKEKVSVRKISPSKTNLICAQIAMTALNISGNDFRSSLKMMMPKMPDLPPQLLNAGNTGGGPDDFESILDALGNERRNNHPKLKQSDKLTVEIEAIESEYLTQEES